MKFAWFSLSIACALGCGQIAPSVDGGDASIDGASNESGADGWSQCESPEHYEVCGGQNDCRPSDCHCASTPCLDCEFIDIDAGLGYCAGGSHADPVNAPDGVCGPGVDGTVCVYVSGGLGQPYWGDYAYDFGVLLAENGYADHVRYADMGQWSGAPIPNSTSCPALGPIQPCGGACGGCPAGSICRGRAPLHPVGFCAPANAQFCGFVGGCSTGDSCFTYVVEPAVQKDADGIGICLPTADCDALAQAIPGGGKCAP